MNDILLNDGEAALIFRKDEIIDLYLEKEYGDDSNKANIQHLLAGFCIWFYNKKELDYLRMSLLEEYENDLLASEIGDGDKACSGGRCSCSKEKRKNGNGSSNIKRGGEVIRRRSSSRSANA